MTLVKSVEETTALWIVVENVGDLEPTLPEVAADPVTEIALEFAMELRSSTGAELAVYLRRKTVLEFASEVSLTIVWVLAEELPLGIATTSVMEPGSFVPVTDFAKLFLAPP